MCQAKQIWSNATQYSQRFETVLCEPIGAKQAYAWRPCPWHIWYFRYGFYNPRSKFLRHSFSVADDHTGSDHFPIQISLDKPLKRSTPLTEPRYRFDKTNDDLLHNILKDSLTNIDTNITTQDELEELAVTLCEKLLEVVDTSTPKVYSRNNPKSPISQAILDLIKEKRRLRRLYNNTQDPNTKSTINRLQKEIRTKINQESTISWEKFCNSISLKSDPKTSWHKITNFLKPKGPRSYPTLKLGNKTAKTNPEKA